MLPPVIPLFPLPNVVLFPGACLPLHVFEPRYRAMVSDVLAGDRLIGLVLLQHGWEEDDEGHPPVYPVGCAGLVTHADRLEDGRYDIVLCGLEKFRIVTELNETGLSLARPYRVARIEPLPEPFQAGERDAIQEGRRRLEAFLATRVTGDGRHGLLPPGIPDGDLINALSQHLALEPLEKQALLERDGLLARCRSLVELLEMKELTGRLSILVKDRTH